MSADKFAIEERIIEMLKTVFDPEIPVNVYDLGLIYKIEVEENGIALFFRKKKSKKGGKYLR